MERFWSRNDTRLSAVGRFWDREGSHKGSPYGVTGAGVEGYRRCVHGGIIARAFVGIKAGAAVRIRILGFPGWGRAAATR